jgi:hypothetical protein
MKRGKILVALQLWAGDLAQGEALAKLCAELTLLANAGQKSPHADFMFALRWDCPLPSCINEITRAFQNVRTFTGRNRISGWPNGCNNLAVETYRHFVAKQQAGLWNYSGLWLTEADSVPLTADYLARVHREWVATDKLVLGCWIGSFPNGNPDGSQAHINGNMVIHHDLARAAPGVLVTPTPIAWDASHRHELVQHGKPSLTIYSDYQLGDEQKNPWRDCAHLWREIVHHNDHPLRGISYQPAWLHGVKDGRGLECVRERLLPAEKVVLTVPS